MADDDLSEIDIGGELGREEAEEEDVAGPLDVVFVTSLLEKWGYELARTIEAFHYIDSAACKGTGERVVSLLSTEKPAVDLEFDEAR